MIAALALLVALQKESLFRTAFPQPTGTNGYEDVLKAADLLGTDPLAKTFARLVTVPPDGILLEPRRKALGELTPVLSVLRGAEGKEISIPDRAGSSLHFGELSAVRSTCRLLLVSAYVNLADGRSSAAWKDLRLTYRIADAQGRRMAQVGSLVASATYAMLFAFLEKSFDGFAPAELIQIEAVADREVETPPWAEVVQAEARQVAGDLQEGAGDFEKAMEGSNKGELPSDPGLRAFMKLPVDRRRAVYVEASQALAKEADRLGQLEDQPERTWIALTKEAETRSAGSKNDPTEVFRDLYRLRLFGAKSFAITRTKWRLIRLAARLRRMMAEEDRAFARLPEDLPANYLEDGLAPGELTFQPTSTGFWLQSPGTPETGPVTLTSRLPKVKEDENP